MQCKPWSEHVCHRASSWTRCGTCRTAPRAWVQKDHRAELASWTIRPDNGQYECQWYTGHTCQVPSIEARLSTSCYAQRRLVLVCSGDTWGGARVLDLPQHDALLDEVRHVLIAVEQRRLEQLHRAGLRPPVPPRHLALHHLREGALAQVPNLFMHTSSMRSIPCRKALGRINLGTCCRRATAVDCDCAFDRRRQARFQCCTCKREHPGPEHRRLVASSSNCRTRFRSAGSMYASPASFTSRCTWLMNCRANK